MKKSKQPKTHFVPRVVFETAFVGVIPICVAAAASACASELTVADLAFDAGGGDGASPAPDASDASATRDATKPDAPIFSVAFIGFDGGVGDNAFSVPDASDAGDARDATHPDAPIFSVAFIGFDGGGDVADAAFRPPDGSAG
jgi:hypothetical protein